MIKLSDIKFKTEQTDYGTRVSAQLVITSSTSVTHCSMQKAGIDIIGITKDNLTQEIIEKLYGQLRDDFDVLLHNDIADIPLEKQNEIYMRTRAIMG